MNNQKPLKGRPPMNAGKRTKKIDARFTEEEYQLVEALEKELGISKTEIIRTRVLHNAKSLVVNASLLISRLDHIGAELGRSGNNLNQLARYANTLKKLNVLSPIVSERLNILLDEHIRQEADLEVALRKIIRQLSR